MLRTKNEGRRRNLTAAGIQYGISILNGLATFVGLKALQHMSASDEIFSRLSIIILSFTTFQLISDLGTQTEFLRAYHHADRHDRPRLGRLLIQSRLLLGVVVLLTAGLYCFASDFSEQMSFSFLIYHLAFIPFALISSTDSIFLARKQFSKAIFSRLARILSLIAFIFAAYQLPARAEIMSPVISTLTFTFFAVVMWFFVSKSLIAENKSSETSFPKADEPSTNSKKLNQHQRSYNQGTFIAGSALAATIIGIQSAHGLAAHSLLVRMLGEQNLTIFNTSLALATPAILAFQTLVQFAVPHAAAWAQGTSQEFMSSYLKFFKRSVFLLILASAGLWTSHSFGLIEWLFPRATEKVVPLCQLLIIAQWAQNCAVPGIVVWQYQRRIRGILSILALSAAISLFAQWWWHLRLQEYAYMLSVFLIGFIPALMTVSLTKRSS
jgi:O-antigen/teichoic acid export membrane protein